MTRRPLAIALALVSLGAAAPAAEADRADDLLLEACRTGRVTGDYSQSDFRKALRRLPADSDQYTDCRDVLRRARLRAVGGGDGGSGGGGAGDDAGGGGGAGGGGFDPATGRRIDPLESATPDERRAVEAAAKAGGGPVALARGSITPGAPGTLAANEMPPALLVLVGLLGLLVLAGTGWLTSSRVRARRRP